MQSLLRYGILTGIFAVLFVPFIVADNFFFPFITGKNFTFRILVEIVFALWVLLMLKEPAARPKPSAFLYALLAFLASLGISTALAENPDKAFWSNFERMEGYISILHIAAYFVVVSSVFTTERIWKAFWNTSIGVSVAIALVGVAQLTGALAINQGGVRVDATFGNATYLAVYMLFHVFITLFAYARFKPVQWVKIAYGIALVLQVAMVFYTATRGTILGLVGGLLVTGLVFTIFGKGMERVRKVGIGVVAGVIVVAGLFVAVKDTEFVRGNDVLSRIASISLEEGTTRFTIWGMALQGAAERPVFGWGQEGFNYVFNKYYEPSLYAQEPWFDRAHNVFFDWLIAGGVVGLALYLSFFGVLLWYLWRPGNEFALSERAIFTGLLAGYGFHNLFVFDNLMSYVLFFSLAAYIAVRRTTNAEPIGGARTLPSVLQGAASGAVIVLLLVVLYAANMPGITRAAGIIDGLKPYEAGVSENFTAIKKTISAHGMGRQEAHEQFLQFALRLLDPSLAQLSTPALRQEVVVAARDAFAAEVARTPNDARLALFYGSFLRQVGDFDGATQALDRALQLSPKKQGILFEIGTLALMKNDADGATAAFKQALDLDPAYKQARAYYAALLLRLGERDEAEALLREGFGTVTPNEPIILQAYNDIGDTARVLEIMRGRVAADPNNFDSKVQLAAAYLNAGERAQAIVALREAIELNPEFKAQGEYYIAEIEAGRNP